MTCPSRTAAAPFPAPAPRPSILAPLFEVFRRLLPDRRRPRLRLDELSAHRLRDLGLHDGR